MYILNVANSKPSLFTRFVKGTSAAASRQLPSSSHRDSLAIQLKLDKLISALNAARNDLIGVEDLDEKSLTI